MLMLIFFFKRTERHQLIWELRHTFWQYKKVMKAHRKEMEVEDIRRLTREPQLAAHLYIILNLFCMNMQPNTFKNNMMLLWPNFLNCKLMIIFIVPTSMIIRIRTLLFGSNAYYSWKDSKRLVHFVTHLLSDLQVL